MTGMLQKSSDKTSYEQGASNCTSDRYVSCNEIMIMVTPYKIQQTYKLKSNNWELSIKVGCVEQTTPHNNKPKPISQSKQNQNTSTWVKSEMHNGDTRVDNTTEAISNTNP